MMRHRICGVGTRSRLDVSLAVGSVGETVTVVGVTPLLSTEAAVGTERLEAELPGRYPTRPPGRASYQHVDGRPSGRSDQPRGLRVPRLAVGAAALPVRTRSRAPVSALRCRPCQ